MVLSRTLLEDYMDHFYWESDQTNTISIWLLDLNVQREGKTVILDQISKRPKVVLNVKTTFFSVIVFFKVFLWIHQKLKNTVKNIEDNPFVPNSSDYSDVNTENKYYPAEKQRKAYIICVFIKRNSSRLLCIVKIQPYRLLNSIRR